MTSNKTARSLRPGQLRRRQGPQTVADHPYVLPGYSRQLLLRQRTGGHGECIKDQPGRGTNRRGTSPKQLRQLLRHRRARPLGICGQQLLDEERIALGPPTQVRGHLLGDGRARQRPGQAADLGRRQRRQHHPHDHPPCRSAATSPDNRRPARPSCSSLSTATTYQHRRGVPADRSRSREWRVGPVQILEQHHEGVPRPTPLKQEDKCGEQPLPLPTLPRPGSTYATQLGQKTPRARPARKTDSR